MSSAALKTFFTSEAYAVVGASKDPSKFGYKVLKWYESAGLSVTPVHPKEPEIEGLKTVASLSDLPADSRTKTSISVITPPKVTLGVVQSAVELGINAIWLQPGAEDAAVVDWIKGQPSETQDKVIYGGPCILVKGRQLAQEQGRL
ncbi:unnamed protein product [Tilletia controversa]|uniref:CoA-binding domain-containing protein n=3 Tax=Tilletia TaxID=13289 RepID=A0A8X7MTQ5_9BASI|nr:hypothetical protein CF336_g4060 [Tilletia laevis]KAE8198103.1 hypothetical protein CF328_g3647 [Tilletia controversa]KAE8261295.1 hypothetical protein A4X03_0g3383 [Tilletia caries]KAE8202954.1 hypothetical protein CF335_g3216 [Tilletia laevis]KAE8247448.1 hypothetical protein A4X06_0g4448 [Tilletia controversa]